MDMKMFTPLLLPLALIYGGISALRNYFFDWGILKSIQTKHKSIGVGNLNVGGTGKSVVIDYLISFFKDQHNLVVLSRGYKRNTSGVVFASKRSTSETIGDEPFQFFKKHNGIDVIVSEQRNKGLAVIDQLKNQPDILLLDDVMQHRYVKTHTLILTSSYQKPYFSDQLLPLGRLRESKSGAARAQIILITKCPEDLTMAQQKKVIDRIKPLSYQSVFLTKIDYAENIINREKERALDSLKSTFLLITGIDNPNPLVSHLEEKKLNFNHLRFSNHHQFSSTEIKKIKSKNSNGLILTTEKDYGRLEAYFSSEVLFYLPITMSFFNNVETKKFQRLLKTPLIQD